MDPKFQTSFIPKSPVVSNAQESRSSSVANTNIFSVVATVLFIAALIASGALFAYKQLLMSQIQAADRSITAARAAFEPEKIKELLDSDSRINSSKTLLERHVVVSKLLILLQNLTVKRMQLTDLTYSNKSGSHSLLMKAEVQTFNALAQQKEIFARNEFVVRPEFSNFTPKDDGVIGVSFSAVIDSGLVSYKKAIESASLNPSSNI